MPCNCEATISAFQKLEYNSPTNEETLYQFSYDDGVFTPLSWLGRIWRHFTGKGFLEDCEPLYIFYRLAYHYKENTETHAHLKERIVKSLDNKYSWFEGSPDPVSDINVCDRCVAAQSAITEVKYGNHKWYQDYRRALRICDGSGNLCRIAKVIEISNKQLGFSISPFKALWNMVTTHKYHELLGFSNGKFYRVTPVEQFLRRVTFRGFSDCESMHVITNALASKHCEHHWKELTTSDGILNTIASFVKDGHKRYQLLTKLHPLQE